MSENPQAPNGPMNDAESRGALARLAGLVLRRPLTLIVLTLATLLPTTFAAQQLQFKQSFTDLLPPSDPAVVDLNAVIDKTGGTAFMVVAVDARDLARAKRFADTLEAELSKLPTVLLVQGRLALDFIKDRRLYYLDEAELDDLTDEIASWIDKKTLAKTGLFVDLEDEGDEQEGGLAGTVEKRMSESGLPKEEYAVTKDGRYLVVFVRLRGHTADVEFGRRAQAEVREGTLALLDGARFPKELDVRFTGSVPIRMEENEMLQNDLKLASYLGFGSVVLLITLYTRRLRTLLLLSLPLLVSVAWTFAFARYAIGHLSIITGFLASILSGLGIESGIHLFLRYMEERRRGLTAEKATVESITSTGRSVISGGFTNASGFFILTLATFAGYREFGILGGLGMLSVVTVTLLFLPASNLVLDRLVPMKQRAASVTHNEGIRVPRWASAMVLTVIPAFAVWSCVALYAGQLKVETNWSNLKGETPTGVFDDYLINGLGASFTQTMLLMGKPGDEKAVKEIVQRVRDERRAAGKVSGVTRVLGVSDLVPADQVARQAKFEGIRKELDRVNPERLSEEDRKLWQEARDLTLMKPFTLDDVPNVLKSRFQTAAGEPRLLVLFTDYMFFETQELLDWSDEMRMIREELTKLDDDAHIMSENWLAGNIFNIITQDGLWLVAASFLAVFFVLLLDFRKVSSALVVVAPLAIAMVCIAGGMVLFDIQLNFINGIVIPCIVGISIDNSIHIYHRYLEEGPDSIPLVLRHTGSATLLASLTNLMGFGSMIVAHHKGLKSVGELATLGIVTAYICTSIFFPLFLERWGRVRHKTRSTLRA